MKSTATSLSLGLALALPLLTCAGANATDAADSGTPDEPPAAQTSPPAAKPKSAPLEEVLVTGTRLTISPAEATQEIQFYPADAIERSGQSNVSDFLNTLPIVSLTVDQGSLQTANAATGVRLHGLPLGTTLVLIDGRRVSISGAAAFDDIFNLNNIPVAAVERIDIQAQGSSAIYGSDGIAGTVNIILKKDFDGLSASVRYGSADETDEVNASMAWGHHWERGSLSLIASYQTQSQLLGSDRSLTADADYTRYGSRDSRFTIGNPGNIFSTTGGNLPGLDAPYAAVPQGFMGPPTQAAYAPTAGQLNKLSLFSQVGLIPESHRTGILLSGGYDVGTHMELFTQLLYSHVKQDQSVGPAGLLYGAPGFQAYTVAATNPFNPFGERVGIGYVFPGVTVNTYDTDFLMPVVGARGRLGESWTWELSTWGSMEREPITVSGQPNAAALQTALDSSNPSTALNPFVAGAPGSQQLVNSVLYTDSQHYRSNDFSASGLLRGTLVRLTAGELKFAIGSEFHHDTLSAVDDTGAGSPVGLSSPTVGRKNYAAYAETKIPVLRPVSANDQNLLDLMAAGRFDHFDDFGGKWTGEAGGALRPIRGLTFRAHWSQAFKAPSLFELYKTPNTLVFPIVDPITGRTTGVTVTEGGNHNLQPETGQSHSFGLVYAHAAVPGLEVSISNWNIHEDNSIQALNPQVIVDNEGDFPGAVVRAESCSGGPPCPIVSVNSTFTNFGSIHAAGIDYLLKYRFEAARIEWQPSLSVTQTYRYNVAFQPGQPATDRVSQANDDTNWAPRWKGTLAIQARKNEWSGAAAARYTGRYRDYDPLLDGTYLNLGDLWFIDANLRYSLQHVAAGLPWARGLAVEIGGVNLFNRQPQFSNRARGFYGFDYLQADMRGRFLYFQVDGHW
jgi:iron complex outermembrane recepter protein